MVSVDLREHFDERGELAGVDFGPIVDRGELFAWLAETRPEIAAIVHLGACSSTTETRLDYLAEWNVEYSKRLFSWATIVAPARPKFSFPSEWS